jgi:hypothetical protein
MSRTRHVDLKCDLEVIEKFTYLRIFLNAPKGLKVTLKVLHISTALTVNDFPKLM